MKKQNLSIRRVLQKFMLIYDIRHEKIKVFFSWKKKQPKWLVDDNGHPYVPEPYITVDFDKKTKQWYLGYIKSVTERRFASIDDISGEYQLQEDLKEY